MDDNSAKTRSQQPRAHREHEIRATSSPVAWPVPETTAPRHHRSAEDTASRNNTRVATRGSGILAARRANAPRACESGHRTIAIALGGRPDERAKMVWSRECMIYLCPDFGQWQTPFADSRSTSKRTGCKTSSERYCGFICRASLQTTSEMCSKHSIIEGFSASLDCAQTSHGFMATRQRPSGQGSSPLHGFK